MKTIQMQRFALFEQSFTVQGAYDNPYLDLAATAELTEPDGSTIRRVPLFWDGGATWKFRFAPDEIGEWQWSVESGDPSLDGQTGALKVTPSAKKGSIGPMAGFPLHFQRQNGAPFWFVGDTGWALFTDDTEKEHDRKAAEKYIDTRARQGFDVIHSMLISEAGWGNCGGDAFADLQAERINPGYWQEVDKRLEYLNDRGIIGGLVLAWADKGTNPNDWREFPSQQARLRYARYIASRYSAFDVYFVVAGEWNADLRHDDELSEDQARADYAGIGEMVRQCDPHGRMIAIHPGGNRSAREFAGESWIDFGDYQQTYRRLHDEALLSRQTGKPVVNAEYAYYLRDQSQNGEVDKHNSFDIETIRHATWDIAMAGAYFISGFGSTYFGGNRHPGPFAVDAPENAIWEEQVQHVKKLFAALPWWRLAPRDELLEYSVERSEDRTRKNQGGGHRGLAAPPETTYWLLSAEGITYLLYARGLSEPLTLSLDGATPDHAFRLRQFDPRTGTFADIGTHAGANPLRYTPPDSGDWALLVERVG